MTSTALVRQFAPPASTALALAPDDEVVRRLDAARRQLSTVTSLAAARVMANEASAVQRLLQRRDRSREVQNLASKLAILAERRCGELFNENPPRRGRPPKSLQRERISSIAVSAIERHRWRKLTKLTVEELERMEADCTASGREFTRAYVERQLRSMLDEDSTKPWDDWSGRKTERIRDGALNRLYGWLAPFQRRTTGVGDDDSHCVEGAIAVVLADDDYLSGHDRALLGKLARRAADLLEPLLEGNE